MSAPQSGFLEGAPRLHYLEWNPRGARTLVLLHGNSANAWWWEPMAAHVGPEFHLLALDQRGHGDSGWVRPPAYGPHDYARDLFRFIQSRALPDPPIVAGHSMGGIGVLAFAQDYPGRARALAAIDVAISSSRGRDRYLRRLKALPTVIYPDLETARARFRLMPDEGGIAPALKGEIALKSLERTGDGRYTLKFDRESFFGSDGIDVARAIAAVREPLLLVRAEHSRIMTAEPAAHAAASNPLARLVTIPAAHHHVPLEKPAELARVILDFAAAL